MLSFRGIGLFCLMLLTAACSGPNAEYYSGGVGSRLTIFDTSNQLALQQQYFNYLCISALIPTQSTGAHCDLPANDTGTWTVITQQGMNDVDRRCDSYLEWLDDRRRSRGPLTQQIGAIGAATAGVLAIAGSSASAISIVAIAFELVSQSLDNYHSRLLMEVDGSTVTAIVMISRQRFREDFTRQVSANGGVRSKPEAEFVLRQYLRLCMPFVIETQINQFSTLGALGVAPTKSNAISTTPIESPRPYTPLAPRQSIRQTPPRPSEIPAAPTDYGQIFTDELVTKVRAGLVDDFRDAQSALCIASPSSTVTSQFKQAIVLFENTLSGTNSYSDPLFGFRGLVVDGKLNETELEVLTSTGGCAKFQRNFFEKRYLPSDGSPRVRQLVTLIAGAVPEVLAPAPTLKASDAAFRDAVRRARVALGLSAQYGGTVADQVDKTLLDKLL